MKCKATIYVLWIHWIIILLYYATDFTVTYQAILVKTCRQEVLVLLQKMIQV